MNDTRKFAIYSRKSKFTGKGESIGIQIELCKQNVRLSYPDVTGEDILIFEDEGFSGGHTRRPQFQEMLKLCRKKQIKCIVCYRLDQISRNFSDYFIAEHIWDNMLEFIKKSKRQEKYNSCLLFLFLSF